MHCVSTVSLSTPPNPAAVSDCLFREGILQERATRMVLKTVSSHTHLMRLVMFLIATDLLAQRTDRDRRAAQEGLPMSQNV